MIDLQPPSPEGAEPARSGTAAHPKNAFPDKQVYAPSPGAALRTGA